MKDNSLNIKIYNNLRLLGIKTSTKSFKLLYKTILYVIQNNIEFDSFTANDVYNAIANIYPIHTPKKIKDNIDYALSHRDIAKCKSNFEKVFNFEYTDDIFTNKSFIEEFCNLL